jgi:hypothetical protein
VTIEAFTLSHFSTLTCFGHYRPSSGGTSILAETTITMYYNVYILRVRAYTVMVVSESIDVPPEDGL